LTPVPFLVDGMKRFEYMARGASGAPERGTLAAADRAGALRLLAERGLAPVSLAEAGAGRGHAPGRWAAAVSGIAAAAAVAVAAAALWRPAVKTAEEPAGGTVRVPADVKKEVADEAVRGPAPKTGGATGEYVRVSDAKTEGAAGGAVRAPGVKTEGALWPTSGPGSVSMVYRPPGAGGGETAAARGVFGRAAESRLALYARPGEAPPPPPPAGADELERQAREALAADIEVYDDDAPETAALKEAVAWLKDGLRRHVGAGGTAAGFYADLAARRGEEAALAAEARALVSGLAAEGKTAEAREALGLLNAEFAGPGLPPVRLPPKWRKALEEGAGGE